MHVATCLLYGHSFQKTMVGVVSCCGCCPGGRGLSAVRRWEALAQVIANQALLQQDTLSEWLRRWTRNPLGSARKGSNPLGVALPQAPQASTQPSRNCNSTATPLAMQACGHSGAVEVWITQTRHASLLLLPSPNIHHANHAHRSAVV